MQSGAPLCAPVMAPYLPDEELVGCALREARLTHHQPLAGDVIAAVAVLCRALLRGEPWCNAVAVARTGRLALNRDTASSGSPADLAGRQEPPELLDSSLRHRRPFQFQARQGWELRE